MAVSTACSALDSIVVENVSTAQKCIDFLKRGNVGRATFICLDKLPSFNMSRINAPEDAPRLFDLITPSEDKFLPAFYQALSDTLVASDLTQANRIAYGKQRFRVVTLDGQLIDKSGTMSGGGSRKQKGGMSAGGAAVNYSDADLEQKNQELDELHEMLHKIRPQMHLNQQELSQLKKQIHHQETICRKLQLDIDSITVGIEDAKNAIKMAQLIFCDIGKALAPTKTTLNAYLCLTSRF